MASEPNDLVETTPNARKRHFMAYRDPLLPIPRAIGGFSICSEQIFRHNTNEIRFLVKPLPTNVCLDMNSEEVYESNNKYIEDMLSFIRENKQQMIMKTALGGEIAGDVVTQSEVLQTIMCTMHVKSDWSIIGTKYKNKIYLRMGDSIMPKAQQTTELLEKQLKRLIYSDSPTTHEPLANALGDFHGVFQCGINGINVIYNASMGANCRARNTSKFIMSKVLHMATNGDGKPDPGQSIMWWAECLLNNVKHICLAKTHPDGSVDPLKFVRLRSLIKAHVDVASQHQCLNFLTYTLKQFRSIMKVDGHNMGYQFNYVASENIIKHTFCGELNKNKFIPDWYCMMLENYK